MIEAVDNQTYGMILLAGGEPSLSPNLIRVGIASSRKAGLLSAMVTAPRWAQTPVAGDHFLSKIPGLNTLILSYDFYHLDFLTIEHYRNAAVEAIKRGIRIVFQIAYTSEEEKEQLIDSLGGLKILANQINPMRTVRVGNAVTANLVADEVQVMEPSDLDSINRGCVLGNSFIDENFNVHGCCWSTAAEESPFSVAADGSPSSVGKAFKNLEARALFQGVRQNGFIDSLSEKGKQAVVDLVRGEKFSSECDLCIRMMSKRAAHVWDECAVSMPSKPEKTVAAGNGKS